MKMERGDRERKESITFNDFQFSHLDDSHPRALKELIGPFWHHVDGDGILLPTTVPLYMCPVRHTVYTTFLLSISSGLLNNLVGYTKLLLLPSLYTETQNLSDLLKITQPTRNRTRSRPGHLTLASALFTNQCYLFTASSAEQPIKFKLRKY